MKKLINKEKNNRLILVLFGFAVTISFANCQLQPQLIPDHEWTITSATCVSGTRFINVYYNGYFPGTTFLDKDLKQLVSLQNFFTLNGQSISQIYGTPNGSAYPLIIKLSASLDSVTNAGIILNINTQWFYESVGNAPGPDIVSAHIHFVNNKIPITFL